MTREEIAATVLRLIKEHLEIDAAAESRFDALGLDSLDRVDLVMAVEMEFDIEVSDDASWDIPDVKGVVDYVANLKVEEPA